VSIAPGDLAFFPADVAHGVRNPQQNREDFVLVSQICPPQFYLYEDGGFYDGANGTMNFPAIESVKRESRWGNLAPAIEVKLRETTPGVRAWNLEVDEIRREGALFNVFKGAGFGDLGTPMLLIL